jgi:hypothetical protein
MQDDSAVERSVVRGPLGSATPLTDDVWSAIAFFLRPDDVTRLALVCRHLRAHVALANGVWEWLLQRDFPRPYLAAAVKLGWIAEGGMPAATSPTELVTGYFRLLRVMPSRPQTRAPSDLALQLRLLDAVFRTPATRWRPMRQLQLMLTGFATRLRPLRNLDAEARAALDTDAGATQYARTCARSILDEHCQRIRHTSADEANVNDYLSVQHHKVQLREERLDTKDDYGVQHNDDVSSDAAEEEAEAVVGEGSHAAAKRARRQKKRREAKLARQANVVTFSTGKAAVRCAQMAGLDFPEPIRPPGLGRITRERLLESKWRPVAGFASACQGCGLSAGVAAVACIGALCGAAALSIFVLPVPSWLPALTPLDTVRTGMIGALLSMRNLSLAAHDVLNDVARSTICTFRPLSWLTVPESASVSQSSIANTTAAAFLAEVAERQPGDGAKAWSYVPGILSLFADPVRGGIRVGRLALTGGAVAMWLGYRRARREGPLRLCAFEHTETPLMPFLFRVAAFALADWALAFVALNATLLPLVMDLAPRVVRWLVVSLPVPCALVSIALVMSRVRDIGPVVLFTALAVLSHLVRVVASRVMDPLFGMLAPQDGGESFWATHVLCGPVFSVGLWYAMHCSLMDAFRRDRARMCTERWTLLPQTVSAYDFPIMMLPPAATGLSVAVGVCVYATSSSPAYGAAAFAGANAWQLVCRYVGANVGLLVSHPSWRLPAT